MVLKTKKAILGAFQEPHILHLDLGKQATDEIIAQCASLLQRNGYQFQDKILHSTDWQKFFYCDRKVEKVKGVALLVYPYTRSDETLTNKIREIPGYDDVAIVTDMVFADADDTTKAVLEAYIAAEMFKMKFDVLLDINDPCSVRRVDEQAKKFIRSILGLTSG